MSSISKLLGPILVRGTGDIASAIAVELFQAGHPILIHEEPRPTALRRGMAFTDAVFDGVANLEGVHAQRVDFLSTLEARLAQREAVLVTTVPFLETLGTLSWIGLVDARLRKRAIPENQRGLAPVAIGIGPNFVAGENVDYAIETSWGDSLGSIIDSGATLALTGEPQSLGGIGKERFVYAPAAGLFRTTLCIGTAVTNGDEVARIDSLVVTAPLSGIIRGLTHDDVQVGERTKIVEIDPTGNPMTAFGVEERPRRIAQGVCRVFERLLDIDK